MNTGLDLPALLSYLEQAVANYRKSAPEVANWLDDLYIRIGDGEEVRLAEVIQATRLWIDGAWEHPNYAQNRIYKVAGTLAISY